MAATPEVPGSRLPSLPLALNDAKRRRVTRACDHCRLKKVKCDGRQPCIHCTVYSFSCTYNRPNVRSKAAPAPLPSLPQLNAILQLMALQSKPLMYTVNENLAACQRVLDTLFPLLSFNVMEDGPCRLDPKRMQQAVALLQQKNPNSITLQDIAEVYANGVSARLSPPSTNIHPVDLHLLLTDDCIETDIKVLLPSKDVALQLIYTTWNKACVLFRFYHRPLLLEEVDLLYLLDPANYTDRQLKFLPFMYLLLACGSLFSKQPTNQQVNNESLEDDGFRYFLEARKLIDISNVSDIPAIQTVVMMTIYLQCLARLSTCYLYIGIALRSALKEGLHRDLGIFHSRRRLNPIEIDTRKRLFYTIYKMDIYINSLLGLPGLINEDEFDQQFPMELDDELVNRDAFLIEQQNGRLSSSACANHHTKVTMILLRIVKELYPIKVRVKPDKPIAPQNIHDTVTGLEAQLKSWLDNLPDELRPRDPGDDKADASIPERFKLANYYLHIAFLNCQISLYRPFIHYISNGDLAKNADPRSLIRGRNCIKVARLVVKLANKMIDQNLLVGTYWFSMYTIFFSIACLVYYFHSANYNQANTFMGVNYAGVYFDDDLNIDAIRKDIEVGKKVLDCMKNMSTLSLRIYNILNKLFEQLNRKTASTMRGGQSLENQQICNDAMVKLSITNFDRINDFAPKPMYEYMDLQQSRDFAELDKDGTSKMQFNVNLFKANHDTEKDSDSKSLSREQFNNYSETSNERGIYALNPMGLEGSDSSNRVDYQSEMQESDRPVDYVPGVIDALDTQIFGRILPPYMLEENARQAADQRDIDTDFVASFEAFDQIDSLDPF